MIRKICAIFGCFFFCSMGGLVGSWISKSQYPVSVLERRVITPEVAPADAARVALHVDRRDQCTVKVQRVISFSDGSRTPVTQEFEPGYGPLGGDRYILRIPIPGNAPKGPANVWSRGYAVCNPIEALPGMATPSDVWIDQFSIGERTKVDPLPPGFEKLAENVNRHVGQ